MCFTLNDSENYHQQRKFGNIAYMCERMECQHSNTLSICHSNRVRFCALLYRWFVFLLCGIEKDQYFITWIGIQKKRKEMKREKKKCLQIYKIKREICMHIEFPNVHTYGNTYIKNMLTKSNFDCNHERKMCEHILYVYIEIYTFLWTDHRISSMCWMIWMKQKSFNRTEMDMKRILNAFYFRSFSK